MHAAGPEIIGVHARAGRALVENHKLLAFLEAPQRRRQGANVQSLRRDTEKMRQNPADFAKQNAQQLAAPRHFKAEQFLDGEAEDVFLIHRRDIIEPVEVRYVLQIGARLHQLFGAAMEETDMRVDALDDFAVEFENEPQDAVRGGMLRTPIKRKSTDRSFAHGGASSLMSVKSSGRAQCGLSLAFSSPGNM